MSGVGVQDFAPVVIGRRANKGSGGSGTAAEGGNKKQAGVVGIGGKLESGAARKLDDNETKAPDTVGREVGKVGFVTRRSSGKVWLNVLALRRLSWLHEKPRSGIRKLSPTI